MKTPGPLILTLNGGSSSVKFAVYGAGDVLERRMHGTLEPIGGSAVRLRFTDVHGNDHEEARPEATDPARVALGLVDWLATQMNFDALSAVGHRVVHGMAHTEPELATRALIDELQSMSWVDPDHVPVEIALIGAVRERAPALPQVACFDTLFHRDMPRVAQLLAIPARFAAKGVRRYGFHGLSYAYLMQALEQLAGAAAAQGRVVLAHLGNGASMAAVHRGRGIDTTMGFTPTAGLPMGTRSGDLDPGLALCLSRLEPMTPQRFNDMVHHESGLLGVSETSSDMRELLASEAHDPRAADAVALFCYQAKKCLGAYAAALGGLDTLVFAGGIGEHAAPVRERICDGLGFLGIAVDAARNAAHAEIISTDASRVTVRVIHTDEQLMLARSVCRVMHYPTSAMAAP